MFTIRPQPRSTMPGQHRVREPQAALEVDLDHAVPERLVGLEEGSSSSQPALLTRIVDRAELARVACSTAADTEAESVTSSGPHRRLPLDRRRGLGRLLSRSRDRDRAAVAGERQRDRAADPAAASGHQRDALAPWRDAQQ